MGSVSAKCIKECSTQKRHWRSRHTLEKILVSAAHARLSYSEMASKWSCKEQWLWSDRDRHLHRTTMTSNKMRSARGCLHIFTLWTSSCPGKEMMITDGKWCLKHLQTADKSSLGEQSKSPSFQIHRHVQTPLKHTTLGIFALPQTNQKNNQALGEFYDFGLLKFTIKMKVS